MTAIVQQILRSVSMTIQNAMILIHHHQRAAMITNETRIRAVEAAEMIIREILKFHQEVIIPLQPVALTQAQH